MITKFIDVIQQCAHLHNLYSLFAIAGALGFSQVPIIWPQYITSQIRKLKDAWEGVPRKALRQLEQVSSRVPWY